MNMEPTVWFFSLAVLVKGIHCACPDGWMSHGERCYHFSHDTETFPGAKIMCDILGGEFVEIQDDEENNYLTAQAGLQKDSFWIGLTDIQEEDTWVWTGSRSPAEYTNWAENEPNNVKTDENCAILRPNGEWNDYSCHNTLHYICENGMADAVIVG